MTNQAAFGSTHFHTGEETCPTDLDLPRAKIKDRLSPRLSPRSSERPHESGASLPRPIRRTGAIQVSGSAARLLRRIGARRRCPRSRFAGPRWWSPSLGRQRARTWWGRPRPPPRHLVFAPVRTKPETGRWRSGSQRNSPDRKKITTNPPQRRTRRAGRTDHCHRLVATR